MSNHGNKFISPSGQELSLIDVETNDGCIVAFFVPFSKVDSWNDDDLIEIVVEFVSQEGETVSGHEHPDFRSYEIQPGDEGFDKDSAVSVALDDLFGTYVRARKEAA